MIQSEPVAAGTAPEKEDGNRPESIARFCLILSAFGEVNGRLFWFLDYPNRCMQIDG